MTNESSHPGWYPDPKRPGQWRWWDGRQWGPSAAEDTPAHDGTPPPSVEPGFYDDPDEPGQKRWRDGQQWTDSTLPGTPPGPVYPGGLPWWKKRSGIALAVVVAIMLLAALASLDSSTSSRGSTAGNRSAPIAPNPAPSALDQMVVAFNGNYSRDAIEARLREAMDAYGLAWTEDNRSRAASVLVTMRREHGIEEMRILDYMICSHVPGMNMHFSEAAALAAVFMDAGDGCR